MATCTLGGRAFRALSRSTLAHDIWLTQRFEACGIDGAAMQAGEDATAFARRLVAALVTSPAIFEVLGGCIIPAERADAEWTPAIAAETAAFLRELTDPDDKAIVRGQIASTIIPFLKAGLVSFVVSTPASADQRPVGEPVSRLAAAAGGPGASAPGTSSFAGSPPSTRRTLREFLPGSSRTR